MRIPPSGCMKPEFGYLQGKITEHCDATRTKRIDAEDGWYCLTATIMKVVEYPLVATTFTKEQLDKLMKPLLKLNLNKIQCNKYFPRKLVYGTELWKLEVWTSKIPFTCNLSSTCMPSSNTITWTPRLMLYSKKTWNWCSIIWAPPCLSGPCPFLIGVF